MSVLDNSSHTIKPIRSPQILSCGRNELSLSFDFSPRGVLKTHLQRYPRQQNSSTHFFTCHIITYSPLSSNKSSFHIKQAFSILTSYPFWKVSVVLMEWERLRDSGMDCIFLMWGRRSRVYALRNRDNWSRGFGWDEARLQIGEILEKKTNASRSRKRFEEKIFGASDCWVIEYQEINSESLCDDLILIIVTDPCSSPLTR